MVNKEAYRELVEELAAKKVTLVAVSKLKSVEDIIALYGLGQRDFGENYVQELLDKQAKLPDDIRWHFIGHLQSNKVKYIAPFVHLIHGVDSCKLLKEINKQGAKLDRRINVLLQVHIAQEETKFGFDETELADVLPQVDNYSFVNIHGLMGMASFSDNKGRVQQEFQSLQQQFELCKRNSSLASSFSIISMGMSGDYQLAIEQGSNMVRIGSLLFGRRQ